MTETYTENHYGDYRETEQSNSLRANGATCGGGSEVLILQRRFSTVIVTDSDVSPTIEAGAGGVETTCQSSLKATRITQEQRTRKSAQHSRQVWDKGGICTNDR